MELGAFLHPHDSSDVTAIVSQQLSRHSGVQRGMGDDQGRALPRLTSSHTTMRRACARLPACVSTEDVNSSPQGSQSSRSLCQAPLAADCARPRHCA